MGQRNEDFYKRLRARVDSWATSGGSDHRWAKYVFLAPDFFHLMVKLIADPNVATRDRLMLGAAIAYFISPFDLLPEAVIGPLGYVDDVALAAYVLDTVINNAGETLVNRHWAGDRDLLLTVQDVLRSARNFLGPGLFKKLAAVADRLRG